MMCEEVVSYPRGWAPLVTLSELGLSRNLVVELSMQTVCPQFKCRYVDDDSDDADGCS